MHLHFLYAAAGGGGSAAAVFGVVPCPGCAGVAGVSAEAGRTADDALV